MKALVLEKLKDEQWSPEQIVGWARVHGIPIVSHEWIYRFIRNDKASGGELYKHLRHRLKHRKRPVGGERAFIPVKVSIDERPVIVDTRARFGDWEIDTIVGKEGKGAIVTIVERQSAFLLMAKLPGGKNAKGLQKAVCQLLGPYMNHVHSITSDNGSEFYEHREIARRLGALFFFAHPYSSWERGLNEYTNKLIRQYIPKKQTFNNFTDEDIKQIQFKINKRPRKGLNFESPKQVFFRQFSNNKKVALGS